MKTNEDDDGRSGNGVCHPYTLNGRPADTKQPTLDSASVERLMASNADGEWPAACMCMSGVYVYERRAHRDERWTAMGWRGRMICDFAMTID